MKTPLTRWSLVGVALGVISVLLGFVSISCVFDPSGIPGSFGMNDKTPPNACQGEVYEYIFDVSGGQAPYTWSVLDKDGNPDPSQSKLPPGLKLTYSPGADSDRAKLAGIPTTLGTFPFMVQVKDSTSPQARTDVTDVTVKVSDFLITSTDLPDLCAGEPYDAKIVICGGTPPLQWATSGSLPSGLKLTAGHLTGTPTGTGQFKFTVSVQDSSSPPKKDDQEFTIESISKLTILSSSPLPQGATGKGYGPFQFQACGGQSPYTWDEPDKKLLAWGLNLSSLGQLTGTPSTPGTQQFRVRVEDSTKPASQTTEKYFLLAVAAGPLALTSTSPLPDATECKGYTYAFSASGGSGSYQWSAGTLPKGLNLDKGGTLFGTPPLPTPNPASLQVTVTDAKDAAKTASKTFSLKVLENPGATPELEITELRHASNKSSFYNMFKVTSPSVNVNIDFRFPTVPSYLNQPMPKASLQLVGGDCAPPLPALNVSTTPKSIGGVSVRVAEFSGSAVNALFTTAGKKAGDTVRLRFSVDVTVDGQTKTFVNILNVQLYEKD